MASLKGCLSTNVGQVEEGENNAGRLPEAGGPRNSYEPLLQDKAAIPGGQAIRDSPWPAAWGPLTGTQVRPERVMQGPEERKQAARLQAQAQTSRWRRPRSERRRRLMDWSHPARLVQEQRASSVPGQQGEQRQG